MASTVLVAMVAVYCAVYAYLIGVSDGLPYVMDNNESFSSLWHAHNALEHGMGRSAGLADEVFSPHAAAHPYVHTHQGNFPRLFAMLIYVAGARSIESQIVVTTFSVGMVAMVMAYLFFIRVGGVLFATICTLLMITDYTVIAQWQVVTYRVWHMFFLFSSMLLVHAMAGSRWKSWIVPALVNFVCLAYFELIFAAFVFAASGLYAIFLLWPNLKRLLTFGVIQGTSLALGVGILLWQLTLYLGWEGVKQDLYLTFIARNHFSNEYELLDVLREFYESNKVIFWYNFQSAEKFRSLPYFVASLTFFDLQPRTPFLVLCSAIPLGAYFCRRFLTPDRLVGLVAVIGTTVRTPSFLLATVLVAAHMSHKLVRGDFGSLQSLSLLLIAVVIAIWIAKSYIATYGGAKEQKSGSSGSMLLLLILAAIAPSVILHSSVESPIVHGFSLGYTVFLAIYGGALFGSAYAAWKRRGDSSPETTTDGPVYGRVALALTSVLTMVIVFISTAGPIALGDRLTTDILRVAEGQHLLAAVTAGVGIAFILWRVGARRPGQIYLALPGLLIAAGLLALHGYLYNDKYSALWRELLAGSFPEWVVPAIVLLLTVVAVYVGSAPSKRAGVGDDPTADRRLAIFWVTGIAAYVIVYFLSPGYVFTGYRFRLVPFTAFHTVTIFGASFTLLAHIASGQHIGNGEHPRTIKWVTGNRIIAGIVALMLGVYWVGVQRQYLRLLPPDHFGIFQRLQEPPYRGQTFAANSYAAPIAAFTGEWAYMDANLNLAFSTHPDGDLLLERSNEYIWFADRDSNPAYKTPRYYLCLAMQTMPGVASRVRGTKGEGPHGCESSSLVKLAMSPERERAIPSPRLVEIDTGGPDRVGFVRWAIIELKWR